MRYAAYINDRPSFRAGIIAMLMLLCLCSCDHKAGMGKAGSCSIVYRQYKAVALADTGQLPGKKIIQFYGGVPDACRDTIADRAILGLFDIIYSDHKCASYILPFLEQLAADNGLSPAINAEAMINIAAYYLYGLRQPDKAQEYLQQADRLPGGLADTSNYKGYLSMMGNYMEEKSRLQDAADYYLRIIRLCEQQRDIPGLAANYGNYSGVFSRMGQYEKAVAIKRKALSYFEQLQQYDKLMIGYVGLGAEYINMGSDQPAIDCFKKALQLKEKGVRNPHAEFDIYINLGAIATGRRSFEEARKYYAIAGTLLETLHDPEREKIYTMASLPARSLAGNVEEDISKVRNYLPEFYAANDLTAARDAASTLYQTYSYQHNYKAATDHLALRDSLQGLLSREENKQYITETEARYETQKKELKIQVQDKVIRQNKILKGLLLALLLILILAIAIMITRFKLIRKKKEAALHHQFTSRLLSNTEEERERIARDLHDGISQNLLILKHQVQHGQQHLNERIDGIIREIRIISRDLHPVMLDKIGLKLSIEHICQQMMESSQLFVTTDISYNSSLGKLEELQLFRMIQEAISNILKYAGAQAAKITIQETATHVITEVADNGKGFDVQAALAGKASFGLLNLRERSKALNGRTEIHSSAGGTLIKIEIPKQT